MSFKKIFFSVLGAFVAFGIIVAVATSEGAERSGAIVGRYLMFGLIIGALAGWAVPKFFGKKVTEQDPKNLTP